MSHELTFQVSIPTDEGFVGRACANPDCGQYFKVLLADHQEELHCPYCGIEFHKNSLLTSDQRDYVTEYAKEEATQHAVSELQKMLKKTFGSNSAVAPASRTSRGVSRSEQSVPTTPNERSIPNSNARPAILGFRSTASSAIVPVVGEEI